MHQNPEIKGWNESGMGSIRVVPGCLHFHSQSRAVEANDFQERTSDDMIRLQRAVNMLVDFYLNRHMADPESLM